MASSAEPPVGRSLIGRLYDDERVRFLAVGGFNTAFGYGVFVLLQFLFGAWIGYLGSLFASHLIASSVAFVLHRRLVFRVKGKVLLDYVRFQSVYLVSLTINTLLLPVFVELLGWNVYLAQALIVCVTVVASFVGHKFFSFRRGPDPAPETAD